MEPPPPVYGTANAAVVAATHVPLLHWEAIHCSADVIEKRSWGFRLNWLTAHGSSGKQKEAPTTNTIRKPPETQFSTWEAA